MYKNFKLSDVFDIKPVQKFSLPGKSYVLDSEIVQDGGKNPYIAAISRNNGITGYSNYPTNNKGDCITLSTTIDPAETVFYQENDFIGRQQIAELRFKDGKYMGRYCGMYFVSLIRKLVEQFNYSYKLTIDYLRNCKISLPTHIVATIDYAEIEAIMAKMGGWTLL